MTLPPLAPEFSALCHLVRQVVQGDRDPEAEARALGAVVSWDDFVAGAVRHRVAGLVLGAPFPGPVAARMAKVARRNSLRGLRQRADLGGLLDAFGQAGVRTIILKGLPLSQRLYGDFCRRGVGDVDLLIDRAEVQAAHAALIAAGYRRQGGDGLRAPDGWLASRAKDVTYGDPAGTLVELHFRLWEEDEPEGWDFPRLWDERSRIDVAGLSLPVLSDRALATYLVIHGARHCWDRLCWLADVAMLFRDEAMRERTVSDCRALGHGREADHAVELVALWLGGKSVQASDPVRLGWFLKAFFAERAWLERPAAGTFRWAVRELRQRAWRVRLADNWRRVARAVYRAAMNPVDQSVLSLPPGMGWLLPVLRPLGWVLRNFFTRRH